MTTGPHAQDNGDMTQAQAQAQAEVQALMAQVAQRQAGTRRALHEAQLARAQLDLDRAELLRHAIEQVNQAQLKPPLPAPALDVDPATRFARQVRRRHSTV